jgi:hypothetical protein
MPLSNADFIPGFKVYHYLINSEAGDKHATGAAEAERGGRVWSDYLLMFYCFSILQYYTGPKT